MDLLKKLLENQDCSSVEVSQEIFDKVVGFVEKEQMKPALQLIGKTFASGICDVRLILYYLYAHFLEVGITGLEEIFPIVMALGDEHSQKLVPVSKRETHFQSSLNWFFSNILKKMKHFERLSKTGQKHPILEKSIAQMQKGDFGEFMQRVVDFQEFFYKKWPESPIKEKVSHLIKRLEEMRSLMVVEKVEEAVEIIEKAEEEVILEKKEPQAPPSSPKEEDASLLKSEPMAVLIKKMKVFEILVEKKDYVKAALVSKDISYIIEHFDPCAYFPHLFSKYLALMARNIGRLGEEWGDENSLKWSSLDKLYKTDIEQFMSL